MFDYWWEIIVPLPDPDHEEYAKCIAKLAYDAALDHAISECEVFASCDGIAQQCINAIRELKGE